MFVGTRTWDMNFREPSRENLKSNIMWHWELYNNGCVHKTRHKYRDLILLSQKHSQKWCLCEFWSMNRSSPGRKNTADAFHRRKSISKIQETWHSNICFWRQCVNSGFRCLQCLRPCYTTFSMPVSSFIKYNNPYL